MKPAAHGVIVRRTWQKHLVTFLMVFGPGLIVMEADNDAGAVSTYMQTGVQYDLHLLWLIVVLLPICYFIQEMVARLGIATGKGHAAIISVPLATVIESGAPRSATTTSNAAATFSPLSDVSAWRRTGRRRMGNARHKRADL